MTRSVEELKAAVCTEIDLKAESAVSVAKRILDTPETGFRERRTAALTARALRGMGIACDEGVAVTGVKGLLDGVGAGPTVAVMGELDSLIVPGHPHADPDTGAAHACGHHAQIGAMLAAAIGLQAPGVMDALSGRVALMAVPAEEYVEIEFRNELRQAGTIEFLGGKPEFIRLGHLDDVDVAMMTHTIGAPKNAGFAVGGTNNGLVAKFVRFSGVAAHAGAAPHAGVNALNAAMIALSAIHAQRETYRDDDTIRVHPIITRGGDAVNSVPSDVRMETFVRGRTIEAFRSAGEKVDRALRAGAMAVGGSVTITTLPGYLPIRNEPALTDLHRANAGSLVGESRVVDLDHRTGSTDMGDVSQIMPVTHPYVVSASGRSHGDDYLVHDYELGVVASGKAMAMTIVDLLANGAAEATQVLGGFRPPLTRSGYLELMRGMVREETFAE